MKSLLKLQVFCAVFGWPLALAALLFFLHFFFNNAEASKPAQILSALNHAQFRLASGPINRCPEKIGVETAADGRSLRVFPMELEWSEIKPNVKPMLEIEGIRQAWEADANAAKSSNSALQRKAVAMATDSLLTAVTSMKVGDGPVIESHTSLSLEEEQLELRLWASMNGLPLTESITCLYQDPKKEPKKVVAPAQAIAQAPAQAIEPHTSSLAQ